MIAMAASLAAMIGVNLFTPLAWTWYVLTGTSVCLAIGYAVSVITKQQVESVPFEAATSELR